MIEQIRLGSTGLHISRLALGMSFGDPSSSTWMLDEQSAEPIVRRALELGFTFFDTADMYADGQGRRLDSAGHWWMRREPAGSES